MLQSLEPSPTLEVNAAWSREIARRVAEVDAGAVELIDWEEVRADLFDDE